MIRPLLAVRRRLRLAAWTMLVRARLRRHGAKLVVEAARGVRFDSFPRVVVVPSGDGGGTTTLRLGAGVSLGRQLTIELWAGGQNRLECGDGVFFMANAHVQLRDGTVAIGRHSHVRDGAVLKATDGTLSVGEEVTISWGVVLACSERIEIGDLAGIGERVSIVDSDHGADGSDTHYLRQPLTTSPIVVGRNVLVSANVAILRGATVGPNAVVAANAVLRAGDYPAGWLIAGVPARPRRALPAVGRVADAAPEERIP